MTTKRPSRRQVLVSMNSTNTSKFIVLSSNHVANINRALKSEIIVNFIYTNQHSLVITTNKVVFLSDLSTIKKYIKNVDTINLENIVVATTRHKVQ